MAVNGQPDPLPCGTEPETLVAQAFEGAPPPSSERLAHQARCVHCQASLASLRALRQDMEVVAAEAVVVPPHFAHRVMARVSGVASDIEVSSAPSGWTTVTERLVGRVARLAAMEIPHVTFALAEVTTTEPDDRVTLAVRLVVDYGVGLHEVAAAVRARVTDEVGRTAGVPVGGVDVLVDELSG